MLLLTVLQLCHASRCWCYWQCYNFVTPVAVGVTGSVTTLSCLSLLVLLTVLQLCHASRCWCYWQCYNFVTPVAVGGYVATPMLTPMLPHQCRVTRLVSCDSGASKEIRIELASRLSLGLEESSLVYREPGGLQMGQP